MKIKYLVTTTESLLSNEPGFESDHGGVSIESFDTVEERNDHFISAVNRTVNYFKSRGKTSKVTYSKTGSVVSILTKLDKEVQLTVISASYLMIDD